MEKPVAESVFVYAAYLKSLLETGEVVLTENPRHTGARRQIEDKE
jgi:hypothetical protein